MLQGLRLHWQLTGRSDLDGGLRWLTEQTKYCAAVLAGKGDELHQPVAAAFDTILVQRVAIEFAVGMVNAAVCSENGRGN